MSAVRTGGVHPVHGRVVGLAAAEAPRVQLFVHATDLILLEDHDLLREPMHDRVGARAEFEERHLHRLFVVEDHVAIEAGL